MRRRINIYSNLDWTIIFLYLGLVLIGWINIYAADFNEEHTSIVDASQRYGKQFRWILISLFLAFLIILLDVKFYSIFAYVIYAVCIGLLIAVLIFGKEVNNSRAWFEFGAIRFQPAEFAKIGTCLALAKFLSGFNVKIQSLKVLFRLAIIIFFPAFLILLEKDAGTTLVFFALILALYREGLPGGTLLIILGVVILFFAVLLFDKIYILVFLFSFALLAYLLVNRNIRHTGTALLIFSLLFLGVWLGNRFLELALSNYYCLLITFTLSAIIFLIYASWHKLKQVVLIIVLLFGAIIFAQSVDYTFQNILKEHQRHRIHSLLGVIEDPQGVGYNVNQSKIAIGSGGFSGKGFLNGTQTNLKFIPEQSTDFIFCTVGEEWGFVGSFVLIGLFMFLLLRIIFLAEKQRSVFSRVFGYGVASLLFFHILVNIGMTIGLMPVIGIPLPFLSYGGSSLMAFTVLLFIFLRLDSSRLELLA